MGVGAGNVGGHADGLVMADDPDVVLRGERVLHLRFPVHRAPSAGAAFAGTTATTAALTSTGAEQESSLLRSGRG